ncbi:MAG: hypothetical protein IJ272_02110 [Clostridia bacterium]|nr:hypothetical protein [Clostridia bacterium]
MYKFYNANARGNFVNDCVVRAISVAEGETWDETYKKLSDIAQHEGILLDDVNFVENYLDKRYKRTCHYSKLVGEFVEEFPEGVYLVTMRGHITVIIDGVLYDIFDCRNRRMWCAWEVNKKKR